MSVRRECIEIEMIVQELGVGISSVSRHSRRVIRVRDAPGAGYIS